MGNEAKRGIAPELYWPMVLVLMMFGFWARATHGVGLTAIILGVWMLMGAVAAATWTVNRWNRWWCGAPYPRCSCSSLRRRWS